MTTRSIPAIDPAGAAGRTGADGDGMVVAIVGSGVDHRHVHFKRYANLKLAGTLQHYDLTLLRDDLKETAGKTVLEQVEAVDRASLNDEALIDMSSHGTHVAAIVGGYADKKDAGRHWPLSEPFMSGVAPKCKIMSLKIIDDAGSFDEFDVLQAIELIEQINRRAGYVAIPIALMTFSMRSDVANYACGHTPICNAIDRLVSSGVVVVVPSGNYGFRRAATPEGSVIEFCSTMSITDPGNAELAITVGATHRFRAQEYGASYFSSRGPTMDGRDKPDLLAPGEKITSAMASKHWKPSSGKGRQAVFADYGVKDGTTMAAAHVAGAVAALLSRRKELVGRPHAVKDLLLTTATDLGRPRHFQGRGLLNLSRALGDESARATAPLPTDRMPRPAPQAASAATHVESAEPVAVARDVGPKRFAVAFSFPGEHRDYVKQVVFALRATLNRNDIFYDKFYEAELSRPDLDVHLLEIYRNDSELVVVFLSADYERKEWCGGLEWRAIRDLIKTREGRTVMPVRMDDTHIPGLLSIDGYISAKNRDPEQIADLIIDRLKANGSRRIP